MKIEDVRIGMKVVPVNKTKGIWNFEEWVWRDTYISNYFKKYGYLYVVGKSKDRVLLQYTTSPQGYAGDLFACEDIHPYVEKTQDKTNKVKALAFYHKIERIKVIRNDRATIVILRDGSKGIAKCSDKDVFSEEIGSKIAYYRAKIAQEKAKVKEKK